MFSNATSKDVLAQIDATRSLTDATTGNVEDSIKYIWMTIVEPNPKTNNNLNDGKEKNISYSNLASCNIRTVHIISVV
jgi:hypothetical protein